MDKEAILNELFPVLIEQLKKQEYIKINRLDEKVLDFIKGKNDDGEIFCTNEKRINKLYHPSDIEVFKKKIIKDEFGNEKVEMAALLADLKSRLLLPKAPSANVIEKDPKQELIDRLETYLRVKQAAERLGQMPVLERDTFATNVGLGHTAVNNVGYAADQLRDALFCIFNRPEPVTHQILQEPVLLEERIAFIEAKLASGEVLSFETLLKPSQGRMGLVVTFMAILELTRQQKVCIISSGIEAPLSIQGAQA